jgi:hypothetical protein
LTDAQSRSGVPFTPISPTPTTHSGSLPRKNNNGTAKRHPDHATNIRNNAPSERSTRFEREKEKLKEAAAAMDRDKNLLKRTRDAEAQAAAAAAAKAAAIAAVKEKKKSAILNEATIIPNPQPQISTPVPSTTNTNTERNQRISLMSDSQIMERLRKVFYIKWVISCLLNVFFSKYRLGGYKWRSQFTVQENQTHWSRVSWFKYMYSNADLLRIELLDLSI